MEIDDITLYKVAGALLDKCGGYVRLPQAALGFGERELVAELEGDEVVVRWAHLSDPEIPR